ncbi:hypothetical protein TNIN_204061 [Trichonephila inaurata madagascariensis]|uniref:Uncharacterized protein n=1 Tax=Trichonephila inaurata madagascariensis TaxID=2747483 RepID=A0A8X6YED4_9ARAC|nr:hypothetical protein TNIN_204061 [Trichonephila inaurata madagascariensis]
MKVLCIVLLAGFLGVVSCDLECMHLQLGHCNLQLARKSHLFDPMCSNNSEFYKCIKFASQECNMKNSAFVKKYLKDLAEICTKGSSKNALYHKHKDCLYRRAPKLVQHCHGPLVKEISAVPNYHEDKYHDEITKMTCKWIDYIEDCIVQTVRVTCGEEAVTFRDISLIYPSP